MRTRCVSRSYLHTLAASCNPSIIVCIALQPRLIRITARRGIACGLPVRRLLRRIRVHARNRRHRHAARAARGDKLGLPVRSATAAACARRLRVYCETVSEASDIRPARIRSAAAARLAVRAFHVPRGSNAPPVVPGIFARILPPSFTLPAPGWRPSTRCALACVPVRPGDGASGAKGAGLPCASRPLIFDAVVLPRAIVWVSFPLSCRFD